MHQLLVTAVIVQTKYLLPPLLYVVPSLNIVDGATHNGCQARRFRPESRQFPAAAARPPSNPNPGGQTNMPIYLPEKQPEFGSKEKIASAPAKPRAKGVVDQ